MRVRVFFDTVSPYAYLGVEQLLRHRALWPRGAVDIELVPFFLGGVMKASANTPPATNPVKGRYLALDVERLGRLHGLPLGASFPSVFPTNTLHAQRCLAALHLQHRTAELEKAALVLWRAYWGGGGADIGSPGGLGQTLEAALGRDVATQLIAESTAEANKRHLQACTEEAVGQGCFGAPWFEVQGPEGRPPIHLWGSDRFEMLCWELGLPYHGPAAAAAKL